MASRGPRASGEPLSPADRARHRALRRMKAVALGALLLMAALFAVGFALQDRVPPLAYLRAAAEGGMVGALADWFAVTALFRRPLGLPVPHTAIIPTRKDEIGRSLGEFVETNFLSAPVVRARLSGTPIARRLGGWLHRQENAERVASEAAAMAGGVLRALSDEQVQDVIESLAREHLIRPGWGEPIGAWLERVIATGAHRGAVDLAADTLGDWLQANPSAFEGLFSGRLPSWLPSVAQRLVDNAVYGEAKAFVAAVRADPGHPARRALDAYLERLAQELQHDPAMQERLEQAKAAIFDSPRLRRLAAEAWSAAKQGLVRELERPDSALRLHLRSALVQLGTRLEHDEALQARVDGSITDAAVFLVDRYRHDIASLITDTVERWDPQETTEKIELLVGPDLQYIRLNGTVVGALAGLAIFAVANTLLG